MAKKRYINTKFWSDDFIIGLKPLERYFFLYLLSNEHTDICGIYELSIKVIQRETNLTEKQIINTLKVLKTRIVYTDGWICIKNFEKHQAVNPKVIEGIKRSKALVPPDILAKLSNNDIDYNSLSKTTIETELLSPTLSPSLKLKPSLITSETSSQVQEIFNLFYNSINKNINFGNKTQRKAVDDMIRLQGFDKVKKVTTLAVQAYGSQYCPVITTPLQLKDKWSAFGVWLKGQQSNQIEDISNL